MYLYLAINLATIFIPFVFSFHPRLRFDKEWKWFWPANLVVAAFFLWWDSWFTSMGVWGFNPQYVSGLHIGNIPVEEVLFFICIPYASVFTLHSLRKIFPRFFIDPVLRDLILYILAGSCVVLSVWFFRNWYTATAFGVCAVTLLVGKLYLKEKMDHFLMMYTIILVPFFIVNGILTGMWIPGEVVWYNDDENLGVRMMTIPLEDVFYGMSLLLGNVIGMEWLKQKIQPR